MFVVLWRHVLEQTLLVTDLVGDREVAKATIAFNIRRALQQQRYVWRAGGWMSV